MTAGEPIGKQDNAFRIVAASAVDLPDAITGAFDVVTVPPFGPDQELSAELLDGTAVLLSDVAPANSAELTDLRWLQLGSAGYAQLAGHRLASRGVTVTNASGVNDIPITEWCVLMMLSLERDFVDILRLQRERDYQRPALYQRELRGRTVGIVGYGGIGREVARLSKALGLSVWAMNRSPIGPALDRFTPADTGDPLGALPDRSFASGEWDAFLPNLDYLVLTVALNDATRGMIGAAQLDLLPA
ncbi:MAG: NAD(P)-dependent oxidoreductase, partial [Nakamurella sp.]